MLIDNETWSKERMKQVYSDVVEPEDSYKTINVAANKGSKPLHQNSIVKGLLVFVMASTVGGVIFLVFNSGGSKKSIANLQTEKAPEIAQEDKGGWKIAAEQGTSNGMGIDVDDANSSAKKPDVAKLEAADKPKVDAAKTPPNAPATVTQPVKPPVIPPSPPITPAPKTAPVVYAPPKPLPIANTSLKSSTVIATPVPKTVASLPSTPKGNVKPIEFKPTNPPISSKSSTVIATPVPKTVASLPLVPKGNIKPIEFKPTNPPISPRPVASLSVAPKLIKPVAANPIAKLVTPPVAVATNPTLAAAPISWEQASAASLYGGDASVMPPPVGGLGVADGGIKNSAKAGNKQQRSNYEGALSPTLLLPAGTNVKGHTVAPYVAGIGKDQGSAPLSIALDEAIELASGYRLPVGTNISFDVSVRDNGSVVAISKNASIGGVEIQIPDGAISLAGADNGLLMAKEVATGGDELTRADIASSIWGGAAGAGRAILQGGSQTTTSTGLLGTTTQTNNNGNPNTIGGIIDGAFTPLATNAQQRAQQTAERIQQRSRLNTIDVNTKVKIFVNAPVQIQIPVTGQQAGQVSEDEESQPPPRLITSNSASPPATEEELPPPPLPQKVMAAQPAAVALPSVVVPVPTVTPLPLNPPKTRISRPW
jgi:hypothetical protein